MYWGRLPQQTQPLPDDGKKSVPHEGGDPALATGTGRPASRFGKEMAVIEAGSGRDGKAGSRALHVLVVEDNPDGRETLRLLLELMGYRVEVARDGVEGLEKALAAPPDLALIDIGLPRLDGYEVARQLRSVLGDRVFLIAQTGYGRPQDRQRAFASGFNVHLCKPINMEQLARSLAQAQPTGS